MKIQKDGIFASSLKNSRQIDEVQLLNLSDELSKNVKDSELIKSKIRPLMESASKDNQNIAFFFDFNSFGQEFDRVINKEFIDGQIAAVDGTDGISPITFSTTQMYASTIVCVTSQKNMGPETFITTTTTKLSELNEKNLNNLWDLSKHIDDACQDQSWPTTYREYKEREVAYNLSDSIKTCLIDGPIFTQNLITQEDGRELLLNMIKQERKYIGVIKNLDSSWAISRWCAQALNSGEGYIICSIQDAFTDRTSGQSNKALKTFSTNTNKYVRGVFRPKLKSFAFECHIDDVPYVVSLLRQDADTQINHEIPSLLMLADLVCRSNNQSGDVKDVLLEKLSNINYLLAADLTDERNSR